MSFRTSVEQELETLLMVALETDDFQRESENGRTKYVFSDISKDAESVRYTVKNLLDSSNEILVINQTQDRINHDNWVYCNCLTVEEYINIKAAAFSLTYEIHNHLIRITLLFTRDIPDEQEE